MSTTAERTESTHGTSPKDRVEAWLDELIHGGERLERRSAFDRLVREGPSAADAAVRRLDRPDLPWYARRNLLALISELGAWPAERSLGPYLEHYHPAVRREAFKLALSRPDRRDWALCTLLEEKDPRCLALGLAAARQGAPEEAVPLLQTLASDPAVSDELQAEAVRAVSAQGGEAARDCLLERARADLAPTGWIRRRLRAERVTAVTLAAVRGLRRWAGDPRVDRFLERARACGDERVRAAAGGR